MRLYKIVLPLSMVVVLITLPNQKAEAQFIVGEVLNQTVGKIIRAMDLGVQRAQNKTIWLQNAQKVIENQLNQLKLTQIAGAGEQQRDLFTKYYEELCTVKTIISGYQKVKQITLTQAAIVRGYQTAWSASRNDGHFSAEELSHISEVYAGILKVSVHNLDELMLVINSFRTQMDDAERLTMIDKIAAQIDANYDDLKRFNHQNILLSLQRAKSEANVHSLKKLYAIPD